MALLLLVSGTLFSAGARAADTLELSVDASQDVIYCEAKLSHELEEIAHALSEGTTITFNWEVEVAAVRDFWLDKQVASVHIAYKVVPDLVSRSWQLLDLGSGITRRVFTIEEALQFLVRLEHFPVLDRSLLEQDVLYRMNIALVEQVGEIKEGWWANLWGAEKNSATLEFSLP